MVEKNDAKRTATTIRGAVEAILVQHNWHPRSAVRDAEAFARVCEDTLAKNGHSDPGAGPKAPAKVAAGV